MDAAQVERIVGGAERRLVLGVGRVVGDLVAVVVVADGVEDREIDIFHRLDVLREGVVLRIPVFRVGHVAQIQPIDAVSRGGRGGVGGERGDEPFAALLGVEFGDDRSAVVRIARFASRDVYVGHDQQQVAGVVRGGQVEIEALRARFGGIYGRIECRKDAVAGRFVARGYGDAHEIGRREVARKGVVAFGVGFHDVRAVGNRDAGDAPAVAADISADISLPGGRGYGAFGRRVGRTAREERQGECRR